MVKFSVRGNIVAVGLPTRNTVTKERMQSNDANTKGKEMEDVRKVTQVF